VLPHAVSARIMAADRTADKICFFINVSPFFCAALDLSTKKPPGGGHWMLDFHHLLIALHMESCDSLTGVSRQPSSSQTGYGL
jgi:hypothetical protein